MFSLSSARDLCIIITGNNYIDKITKSRQTEVQSLDIPLCAISSLEILLSTVFSFSSILAKFQVKDEVFTKKVFF